MGDKVEKYKIYTPVALVVFNRLDCAMELLDAVRKAAPEKLYIIADGPRDGKEGEAQKVAEVRQYIENHVDWKCDVKYNYAEKNMGSKYRIYSGINWVFEQEEKAIILEDDCIPSLDFFRYCQELLELYQNEESVWMISGKNVIRRQDSTEQYFFARFSETWGWATWKRAWSQIDIEMDSWPEARKTGALRYAYDFFSYRCYLREADYQVKAKRDAWDIPWRYSIFLHHGVGIVPRENMIANIGCGREDASNTTEAVDDDFSYGKPIVFPLKKQDKIVVDQTYDKTCLAQGAGIRKEMRYIIGRIKNIPSKLVKHKK